MKLFAIVTVAVLATLGIVFAQTALRTDHEELPDNTFTMRIISNVLNLQVGIRSGAWAMTDMGAGSVGFSFLIVQNVGDIDLTYSLESVSSEDVLARLMTLTIRDLGIDSSIVQCDEFFFNVVGPVDLYSGVIGSVAGTAILGVKGAAQPSNRFLAGDHSGLVGGSEEILCLRVEVDPSLTNAQVFALSGQATSVTFLFDAVGVGN